MTEEAPARLPGWSPKHPGLIALGLYVVISVIFFGPGLLPGHTTSAADYLWGAPPWNTMIPRGVPRVNSHPLVVGSNPQLVDAVTVFEPFLQYTRSMLPHVPLWDPYIMGGMPYLGDMQSAVFSPFSILAYVLPFWWSLSVIAVMKVVVASMGAYLLARVFKMGFAGSFLCGVVYGFGLFMIAWLPWPLTNVFPLIPWMLVATERLIRRPGLLTGAAMSAVVALQFFGGHPESSMQALLITAGYFVLRVLQSPGGGATAMAEAGRDGLSRVAALARTVSRPVLAFVIALALGTALCAVTILPFLELLWSSSDLASRPRSQVHVLPRYFFAGFLPGYFPGAFEIETAFYLGALPMMLAVIALLRPRVERIAVAVAACLSLAVVLGLEPFFWTAAHIPGLDFTYLSRFTIMYLLCMALLAGFGLDDLVRHRAGLRYGLSAASAAVVLLILPLVVVVVTRGAPAHFFGRALGYGLRLFTGDKVPREYLQPVTRLADLVIWILVAGAGAVLLGLRLGRRLSPRVFATLAVVLVIGDLFQAGMDYNPAIPDSHAEQPLTGAIRYLQGQGSSRYVAVTPNGDSNPLPPDVNLRYGIYDLRGYDLPVVTRYGRMWTRYVSPPNVFLPLDTPSVPLSVFGTLPPDAVKVLSLFGVRDIVEQQGARPLTTPGFRLAYDKSDARIYDNTNALPRAWLVGGEVVVNSSTAALADIVAPGFRPRREVISEDKLPVFAASRTGDAGASTGRATITHYGTEQVTIDARATRRSELVLSDIYYPGWRATVNGRPAGIDEVDYLLRGVAVPAGEDRIVFTYDPASFRAGWMISLGAAVLLAGGVVIALARRKRPRDRHEAASADADGRPARPRGAEHSMLHSGSEAPPSRSPPSP